MVPVSDQTVDTAAPAAPPRSSTGNYLLETAQTVLTALILAFIFRAFLVEAFVIPTGSMASSLLGEHGTVVCPECGWEYDFGPSHVGRGNAPGPLPAATLCPNCHRRSSARPDQAAGRRRTGDRILVHKWPFVLGGPLRPRRWDVVVFRDPADPAQNYIKRVIGLPGESIEIVDGDVYITDPESGLTRIARKTRAAQSALWFVVFDQSYLPLRPDQSDQQARWIAEPAASRAGLGWYGLDSRIIHYGGLDGPSRAIRFEGAESPRYLQDVYAYNNGGSANWVGDVRLVGELTLRAGDGRLRLEIIRDGRLFAVRLDRDGSVALSMGPDGAGESETVLGLARVRRPRDGRPLVFEFGVVDRRAYFELDGRRILETADETLAPQLEALRTFRRTTPPTIRLIAASLSLELRGLRIDRDVHYTYRAGTTQRAFAGSAFKLHDDEYFVLGDNSPQSHDSREWYRAGPHLARRGPGQPEYRLGTVRSDQIVGRAFFVYLPGLLPIEGSGVWRMLDLGRVRFVR